MIEKKTLLEKIRGLPLGTRKMILFGIVIILGIVFVYFWAKFFVQGFEGFQTEEMMRGFKIPSLKESLRKEREGIWKDLPDMNIPEPSELEEEFPI